MLLVDFLVALWNIHTRTTVGGTDPTPLAMFEALEGTQSSTHYPESVSIIVSCLFLTRWGLPEIDRSG